MNYVARALCASAVLWPGTASGQVAFELTGGGKFHKQAVFKVSERPVSCIRSMWRGDGFGTLLVSGGLGSVAYITGEQFAKFAVAAPERAEVVLKSGRRKDLPIRPTTGPGTLAVEIDRTVAEFMREARKAEMVVTTSAGTRSVEFFASSLSEAWDANAMCLTSVKSDVVLNPDAMNAVRILWLAMMDDRWDYKLQAGLSLYEGGPFGRWDDVASVLLYEYYLQGRNSLFLAARPGPDEQRA